ncbi:nucleoside monophosphate kinase [Patescibacteria group bacterium]|nr:nucleoside monophosphate kinase [Patescibacteria group bacterium]
MTRVNQKPKAIILIGPPCCGKGNPRIQLEKAGFVAIENSQLIRDYLTTHKSDTDHQGQMTSGTLVDDSLVIELLKEFLDGVDSKRDIVIDGFPRTAAQAEWLVEYLDMRGWDARYLVFELPDSECWQRHYGRKNEIKRIDDPDKIYAHRLEQYHQNIFKVLWVLKRTSRNSIREVNAKVSMESVWSFVSLIAGVDMVSK